MMISGNARSAFLLAGLLSASVSASAKSLYVAASGGSDQNPGSSPSAPLATIAAASSRAGAGDTVYLIAGQYHEAIVPQSSGTPGHPITYTSYNGAAVISNVKVAVLISSVGYITIDGINVNGGSAPPNSNVSTFVAIQNGNHIVVQNGNFKYANGWSGIDISGKYLANGAFWQYAPQNALQGTSSYITIQNNTVDSVGNYAVPNGDDIQASNGDIDHVLIQHNTLTHGGHDLVEFDGDYGVLQNNTLNNSFADTVGGDTGYRSIEVRGNYNVIQGNLMEHARLGGGSYVAPIASIRGNSNIVRQNVFYDAIAGGTGTWCGPGSDQQVTNARIYNNTLQQLGGDAWSAWAYQGCTSMGGFVFANNLVVNSRMAPGTIPNVSHGGTVIDADVVFVPLSGGPTAQSIVKGNLFYPSGGGPAYVFLMGNGGRVALNSASGNYPQVFMANVQSRPTLVSASPTALADFQQQPSSPGVGAGVFLTNAVGSGTSSTLPVGDSLYFSDGNNLMPGDTIQLQGTTQRGVVLSINRNSNTLTLSSVVSFKDGQGVALAYNGNAPDIGAGGPQTAPSVKPMAPSRVVVGR
ncbi:MAG TPA: hypothetical protein VMG11_12210 [Steroidobacteraceae bacterium]|nr:hypothetical protein [Steroidobacteraceae bacterium]